MNDSEPRCRGCRTEVGPTLHTHSGYTIRGYRIFSGDLVPATIQAREDDRGLSKDYMRLVDPEVLWLCTECINDTELLQRLYPSADE